MASAEYNKVGRKCNAQFSLLCGAGGMVGNVHRTKLSDGRAGHCCFSILCNKTRIRSSALFGRKLLVASVRSVEVQIRSGADDSVRIDWLVAHLFKMKNTVAIFFLMPWLPFSRGRRSAGHDKALPSWPFELRLRGRRFLFVTASHVISWFIKIDMKQIYCNYSRTQKIQNGFLPFLSIFLTSTFLLNRNKH